MDGKDLKLARIIKNVNQYELAAMLNMPAPTLSEIEHGRLKSRLTPDLVQRIRQAINELAKTSF